MSDTITATFTAARRARLQTHLDVLDAMERVVAQHGLDVDPLPDWAGEWVYIEPAIEGDEVRRREALAWLARHARAVSLIARELGHDGPVRKVADADEFGVEVYPEIGGRLVRLRAVVPAALTCEMVDTGRTETVPATPERTVPVMERVCPPSIFQGIEQEVVA